MRGGLSARFKNTVANAFLGKIFFGNAGAVVGAAVGASGRSNGFFKEPNTKRFSGGDLRRSRNRKRRWKGKRQFEIKINS